MHPFKGAAPGIVPAALAQATIPLTVFPLPSLTTPLQMVPELYHESPSVHRKAQVLGLACPNKVVFETENNKSKTPIESLL